MDEDTNINTYFLFIGIKIYQKSIKLIYIYNQYYTYTIMLPEI